MKHEKLRNANRGIRINKRSDMLPELITRYGIQMLDSIHRCVEAWPPRWLK